MTPLERVRQMGAFARFVLAALVLTMAIRFAVVAFSASGAPPAAAGSGIAAAPPGAPGERPAPVASGPAGQPIRVRISVLTGPDRADVYIDGTQRGQVPYLGDLSCLAGENVVVEIVPKKGKKLRFDRPCESGTIRVH